MVDRPLHLHPILNHFHSLFPQPLRPSTLKSNFLTQYHTGFTLPHSIVLFIFIQPFRCLSILPLHLLPP